MQKEHNTVSMAKTRRDEARSFSSKNGYGVSMYEMRVFRLCIFQESAGTQNGPKLPGPQVKMTRKPKHQEVFIPNKKSAEFGAILGSEA